MTGEPWSLPEHPGADYFDELADAVRRLRAGERVRILGTLVEAVRDRPAPLAPGDVLDGFCGGEFGRGSYEDKRVEAVGPGYVVASVETSRGLRFDFAATDPDALIRYRRNR